MPSHPFSKTNPIGVLCRPTRRPTSARCSAGVCGRMHRSDSHTLALPGSKLTKDRRMSRSTLQVGPSAQPVVARWRRLAWILTAVSGFAVGVSVVLFLWRPWRAPPPAPPLRLSTELGAEVSLAVGASTTLILSPDGNTLAFVGDKAGKRQLYVRRLGQLQATPLAGTEDATDPFFSPDGQWIAFFATSKLKKISVAGGAAVTLCDAPNDRGGSWGDDDNIVFSLNTPGVGLQRVFSGGGKVEPITKTAEGEGIHRWPQVL